MQRAGGRGDVGVCWLGMGGRSKPMWLLGGVVMWSCGRRIDVGIEWYEFGPEEAFEVVHSGGFFGAGFLLLT